MEVRLPQGGTPVLEVPSLFGTEVGLPPPSRVWMVQVHDRILMCYAHKYSDKRTRLYRSNDKD